MEITTQPVLEQEFYDSIDMALGMAEKPYSHNGSIGGFPESVVRFIKGEAVGGNIENNPDEFVIAQLKEGDKNGLPAERVKILAEKLGVDFSKGTPIFNTDTTGDWIVKGDYQLSGAVLPTQVAGLTMVYRKHGPDNDVLLKREKTS